MAAATDTNRQGFALLAGTPDSAARRHLTAAVTFLVIGATVALLAGIKLAFPGVFDQTAVAGYARLRPIALNLLVHGFGFLFITSVTYYLVPRLTGRKLPFEPLANLNLVAAVAIVAAGSVGLGFGLNSGNDLAEFGLLLDILYFLVTLVPGMIVTVALVARRVNTIYPSLAFAAAAQLIYPWLYLVGNLWGLDGVGGQLQDTFMVGGILSVALPAAALAGVYYLIPRDSEQPLFSRPLAMAGFWTLLFTGLISGQTRFVAGPAPDWLDTVGAVMSLGLIITALTVAVNVWYTLDGAWDRITESPALQLTLAGVAGYLFVSVLFGIHGFRSIGTLVGLTVWYETLMLATLLGSMALLAAGFAYHAYPRMSGHAVFSGDAARAHLKLTVWGMGLFVAIGVIAAFTTSMTWTANVVSGAASNFGDGFFESMGSVRTLIRLNLLPLLAGVTAVILFGINYYRTLTSGRATVAESLVEMDDE